ncbi:MAG: (2Fe-2S)-binding protein [Prolixibacteraceae bacterium]
MASKKNRTVCNCNGITEAEILRILNKGAEGIDDVSKFTLAGTSCGRCRVEIKAILEAYNKVKKPDFQHKIIF